MSVQLCFLSCARVSRHRLAPWLGSFGGCVPGDLYNCLKGGCGEVGSGSLPRLMRGNGFRLHRGVFRIRYWGGEITERVSRHWNELPRVLVELLFKRCLDVAFGGEDGDAGERIRDLTGLFPPLMTLTSALSVSCAHPEPCGGLFPGPQTGPCSSQNHGKLRNTSQPAGSPGSCHPPPPH